MKKVTLAMLSILAFLMVSTLPIRPSQASIDAVAWTNPTYRGYDDYLDEWVVAYEEGATWEVSVMVHNNYNPPGPAVRAQINISTLIVWFGWGKNYTHRFATPEAIGPDETRFFTFSNITPSTDEAPELWTYQYRLIIEVVNATTGPLDFVFYWSYWNWDSRFAVYSLDHLEVQQLRDELESFYSMMMAWLPANVTQARILLFQGYFEYYQGYQAHERGDLSLAKTHFETADGLYNQALSVYEQRGTAIEDAELLYREALANSTRDSGQASLISANAALINSYAVMFFGIGWVLIGIGIIVYGMRRPQPPQ